MTNVLPLFQVTCESCTHGRAAEGNPSQTDCHRYPPTVCVVLFPQQHPISGQTGLVPMPISAFPQLSKDDVCGEWKKRLSALMNQ